MAINIGDLGSSLGGSTSSSPTTQSQPANASPGTDTGTDQAGSGGWYVFLGCTGAILLAGTPLAPGVLALMTIAVLYQLEHLISGTTGNGTSLV